MEFKVVEATRNGPNASASVVLERDRWDDFGFKTQYHVHYFGDEYQGFVGNVKILKLGQQESAASLLPLGTLAPLPDDFCSVGQSLDYYERLAALPASVRNEILNFLRDGLSHPEHAKRFEGEKGWKTSVLRDLDFDNFAPLARTLLDRDYNSLPSVGLDLAFQAAGWSVPLRLNFAAPGDEDDIFMERKSRLPERVAVITGRNGSGKSTLLARLARVLHASQADRSRDALLKLGAIEPRGIGFTRVVTVAYSAFDTFQVPGLDATERRQMIADLRAGTGRYFFCGLRDIARELEETLNQEVRAAGDATDSGFALDRQNRTHLKSAAQLADEYARTIEAIFKSGRDRLFFRVLTIIAGDPSFSDAQGEAVALMLGIDPRETFMGWSTGHKIVMHTAATLVAHTQRKSIVLMDEPESHLHPPLLAALMHAVRIILDANDAFAVVATHSPVVVQETLGRHVSVVNRVGDVVTILSPKIETYGESIGEITDEVFGLHAGATDFHKTLGDLVESGKSLKEIESLFDRGMSLQARAYVVSLLSSREA